MPKDSSMPPLPEVGLSGGVDPNVLHPVSDVLDAGGAGDRPPGDDLTVHGTAPDRPGGHLPHEVERALLAARDKQWEARLAEHARGAEIREVDTALKVHLGDANIPANSVGEAQFRADIQDLRIDLHQSYGTEVDGQRKDRTWYLGRASEFVKSRAARVLADNTDGADHLPSMRGSGDQPDDLFNASRVLTRLSDLGKTGKPIPEIAKLDGAVEFDWIRELAEREDVRRMSAMIPAAGPRSLHIPIPLAAVEREAGMAELVRFAETYGSEAATRREHTYRRDELIPYFRPPDNSAFLGVRRPMIANDLTLPTLATSLVAQWLAENAEIAADEIGVTVQRTSPKRIAVRDDLSWMLLAAADQQFGTVPVVLSEMYAAVGQEMEKAIYIGSGATQPAGVWGASGVHSPTVSAPASYAEMLQFLTEIAEENIDVTMARFVTTWPMMAKLATTLNFSSTGVVTSAARPLFEESRDDYPMGAGRGRIIGFPAAITTQMPAAATSATVLTGGALSTILFGAWRHYLAPDYSVAFLTIDDVSQAVTAQTRITLNKFCDGLVRLAKAWARGFWATT